MGKISTEHFTVDDWEEFLNSEPETDDFTDEDWEEFNEPGEEQPLDFEDKTGDRWYDQDNEFNDE